MGNVVNPVEFRLDTIRNWSHTFFVSEDYAYVAHQQHVLQLALYSSLRYLDIRINRRLRMSSALGISLGAQQDNLLVIIKWKIYWRNLLRCVRASAGVFAPYRRRHPAGKLKGGRRLKKDLFLSSTFRNPGSSFSSFYKSAFNFFYLLPLVDAYKTLVVHTCRSVVPAVRGVRVIMLQQRPVFSARIILTKLARRFRIRRIKVGSVLYYGLRILRRYTTRGYIKGYKLAFSGRFSRRDRATFTWKGAGTLSYGTKLAKITYSSRRLHLRYSCCVIKLWVCLT